MVPAVSVTYQRKRMVLLALVAAVAAAMLLTGCSGDVQQAESPSPAVSADPFVGTWRVESADATFVISSDDGQYRILAVSPGLSAATDLGACTREGASLVSRSESGEIAGDMHRFTLTSDPTTLNVVELKEGESQPTRAVAVKVSASTASPTPSPIQ